MSLYGTLRTGGFCLFDNKIYLIPPPLKGSGVFLWSPPPLIRGQLSTDLPPPLYTRLTTNGPPSIPPENHVTPWKNLRLPPAMNNEVVCQLRGLGESEGFVCFTITVTSFPSKALEYFYDSPPPPHWRSIFYSSPLYSISDEDCPPPFTSNPSYPSELKTSHPCPPPPPPSLGDEWWLLPYVKYFSLYLISRQALPIVWWQRKISLCYSRVQIKRQLRRYHLHTLLYRPCPNHTSRWISLLNHTSRIIFLTNHASREKE